MTVYMSKTHGPTEIEDMHTAHILNAMKKQYREWLEEIFSNLKEDEDIDELLVHLHNGPIDTPNVVDFLNELTKRRQLQKIETNNHLNVFVRKE